MQVVILEERTEKLDIITHCKLTNEQEEVENLDLLVTWEGEKRNERTQKEIEKGVTSKQWKVYNFLSGVWIHGMNWKRK